MSVLDVRHDRHRQVFPVADLLLLDLPEAQPVIARIGRHVCADYPHRMAHVLRVASVAVAAKRLHASRLAEGLL